MKQRQELTVNGEALSAAQENALTIELYLQEHFEFRSNVLNGKLEYRIKKEDGAYRPLTLEAQNSIVLDVLRNDVCEEGSPQQLINLYLHSNEIRRYDPIREYLEHLPKWDGHNHVADLFNRLPGVTSEQAGYLAVWLRSAVAHWLQLDTLHGNECVPTLIGAQGCGKTTFLCRLLPQHLRQYYLDHLNLSNKFDKEMALTNNLFVNLDELDAIRPSQHAALKQTLSKSKVNGRPIYGASQEDRARYASFVATTNNPHPLTDATGSRRYICLQIPEGQYINNAGEIDYDQLYAQVLHEVMDEKAPYWFSNEEVARIQELNQNFMEKKDMAELVNACFRKPKEGEAVVPMVGAKMLEVIKHSFPALTINSSAKIQLGFAMKELGYENVHYGNVAHYKAVPKKIA
jgi:predicted P-loop ATPase